MVIFELKIRGEQYVSVKILDWRLKMMKIQFGPLICENYSLVPELWKITNWSLEPIPRFWTE
jgi:hypothetical protein